MKWSGHCFVTQRTLAPFGGVEGAAGAILSNRAVYGETSWNIVLINFPILLTARQNWLRFSNDFYFSNFSPSAPNMIFPDFRNSYDSETFGKQLFKSSREKNVVFSCFERSDVQKFGQQPRQSRLEPPQPTKNWMCHNSPRIYEQSKNNNTYYASHE